MDTDVIASLNKAEELAKKCGPEIEDETELAIHKYVLQTEGRPSLVMFALFLFWLWFWH